MKQTPPPSAVAIPLADAQATTALAEWLAPRLAAGDCLLLHGPIGAGKTHFARAVIQHLQAAHGAVEEVPSPSFTLVQTYQAGPLEIFHCDLYRLTAADEVLELGLDEALASALCLIEWPDRLGSAIPADALLLTFSPTPDDSRMLLATATAPRWQGVLADMGGWHDGI